MAKRLIIILCVVVCLVPTFSIFASAASTFDMNQLAWNAHENVIQYDVAPNTSFTSMGTNFYIADTGVVTMTANASSATSSEIAFVEVPTNIGQSTHLLCKFEFISASPSNAGFTQFDIIIHVNGLYYDTYSLMSRDYFFVPISSGSNVSIRVSYQDNIGIGEYSFRPIIVDGASGTLAYTFVTLPVVWLSNYSSTGSGSYEQGYDEGYANGYYEGNTDGYSQGYEEGYSRGEQDGYDGAYDEGYNVGFLEGYDEGVKGKNDLITSLFINASYSALCSLESGGEITVPITPNLTVDGCYFDTAYDEIADAIGTDLSVLDRVTIILTWTNDKAFDYLATPIYISGDSDVSSAQIWTINGQSYSLSTENWTGSDPLLIQEVVNGTVIVNKFALRVGRPDDLLMAFNLYSPSKAYSDGYSDGYDDGFGSGEEEGYINGRSVGFREGFIDGKAEGSANAQNGTWHELVGAVIDAPINAFRSLFNFEILGLDMRLAIGSLLTIVVLLIIIKKLVL